MLVLSGLVGTMERFVETFGGPAGVVLFTACRINRTHFYWVCSHHHLAYQYPQHREYPDQQRTWPKGTHGVGTDGREGSNCGHPLDEADPPPGWSSVGDGDVDPSQGVSTLVTFVLAGLGHKDHRDHHGHSSSFKTESEISI